MVFSKKKLNGLLAGGLNSNSVRVVLRQYFESFALAIVIALILRFFVVSSFQVTLDSMSPTLRRGDFVLAYKLPYGWPIPFMGGKKLGRRSPLRGEVVVIRPPKNQSILNARRVVAVAGDRVEARAGRLYVNDVASSYSKIKGLRLDSVENEVSRGDVELFVEYSQGYSHPVLLGTKARAESVGPIVIPPGHLFLLGDNREIEDDSRQWGVVPETYIVGKALLIWLSLDWSDHDGQSGWPELRKERLFQAVD
jgi:signal peptidase I